MHSPLENVGSFQGEGQHAHHERQQQQDHISDIETEDDGRNGERVGPGDDTVKRASQKGSPSRMARPSAWRTTANAETRIAPKSHPSIKANQAALERSASHPFPNTRKTAVVAMLTSSGHS